MRKKVLLLPMLAGIAFSYAQQMPKDTIQVEELKEVVIVSTRGNEKLSEIPASVTVINKNTLQNLTKQTSDITNVLSLMVPGMGQGSGSYSNWGQKLRGRDFLVMIDGVPQSTPLVPGSADVKSVLPFDIKSVEVIKGATSIYGNGGSGGFINYITKSPMSRKPIAGETNIWGTSGLSETKDALGFGVHQSLTGTLGKFSYYTGLSYEQTGNKYDAKGKPLFPVFGLDNSKILGFYAKTNYQISENQKIGFTGNFYQSELDTPFAPYNTVVKVFNQKGDFEIIPGYGVPKASNYPEKPTGLSTANLVLNYDLKNIFSATTDFSVDAYYNTSKNIFYYDPTFFQGGGQAYIASEKLGIRPNFNTQFYTENIGYTLTYGLDVVNDKTNRTLLDGRTWVPNLNLVSVAPYLQAKFKLYNDFVVKTGVRYDNMNLDVAPYNTLPTVRSNGTYNPSNKIDGGSAKFNNVSYNIGLRYVKYGEFIPYFNYSQGFSLPNVGRILQGATNPKVVSTLSLEAPVTNNYEFGFASYFSRLRLEATGYYSTSEIGTGLVYNNVENRYEPALTPQKIFGVDVSAETDIIKNQLILGVTYSYVEGLMHTKDDPYNLSYISDEYIAPAKTTAYLIYTPTEKTRFFLSTTHSGERKRFAPVSDGVGGWRYNYAQVPIKAYTVVDFSVNHQFTKQWGVSLAVNNLFNAYYLPVRSQWASPLGNKTSVGEGVNGRLGISYKF